MRVSPIIGRAGGGLAGGAALLTDWNLTSDGYYSWTVPEGVTNISIVAMSTSIPVNRLDGDGYQYYRGAPGGCLRYANNITVTPGEVLRWQINANRTGVERSGGAVLVRAVVLFGGQQSVGSGYDGGAFATNDFHSGGGGAGGYTSAGGQATATVQGGQGVSLSGGGPGGQGSAMPGTDGGDFGGGPAGTLANYNAAARARPGIRIIWPGDQRQFPNLNTGDL